MLVPHDRERTRATPEAIGVVNIADFAAAVDAARHWAEVIVIAPGHCSLDRPRPLRRDGQTAVPSVGHRDLAWPYGMGEVARDGIVGIFDPGGVRLVTFPIESWP